MKYIVGNWKMNPETLEEAKRLFTDISNALFNFDFKDIQAAVCPPFVWLTELKKIPSKINLGAQDVFYENKGIFTGQISPTMLRDIGVKLVLIGHSEKRRFGGERSETINKKIKACLNVGITPVYIIGDLNANSIEEENFDIITEKLMQELDGVKSDGLRNILLVYEPVFAISKGFGTGKAVPHNHAVRVISFLRNFLSKTFKLNDKYVKILYGGSSDATNGPLFLQYNEIDGLLPGGASLVSKEFTSIIKAAQNG